MPTKCDLKKTLQTVGRRPNDAGGTPCGLVDYLHVFGVSAVERRWRQLKGAILNSDKLRELGSERLRVMGALAKEGDGLGLVELSKESEAVDIDQVTAREQTLEQELKDLRGRLTAAAEHRTQTRSALVSIGGDDRAAEAAGRQTSSARGTARGG
jgi:hypothetical protein